MTSHKEVRNEKIDFAYISIEKNPVFDYIILFQMNKQNM